MLKTTTPTTVAEFIANRLAVIDKTQREVAEECGFDTPNIITMFKQGKTKLPLDRIGSLAKALDADPAHMLRLAMQEYMPHTWSRIEDILHTTILTEHELALIHTYRDSTGDGDPKATVINGGSVVAVVVA